MKINLTKTPTNPIIIEGFPGFGLVGTIVTEFLIDHLKVEKIGEFVYDELQPIVAIHKGKLVKPMVVYYSKQYNLIILHTILNVQGFEWKIAEQILELCKKTKAKEILSIEGVNMSAFPLGKNRMFYFGDEKLGKLGAEPIKESIIMGVTAAVMTRFKNIKCIFAGTNSALPDSKAAAEVIKILDKYLNLKVDYKPLLKQASQFEGKLKGLMQQSQSLTREAEKKQLSYLG
ncbi:MAG: PAC2 family protein [archaeon]